MTVDEAIEKLKSAKEAGVKNIIAAWWFSDQFQRPDDELWAADAEAVEDKMDWSATHEDILEILDLRASDWLDGHEKTGA